MCPYVQQSGKTKVKGYGPGWESGKGNGKATDAFERDYNHILSPDGFKCFLHSTSLCQESHYLPPLVSNFAIFEDGQVVRFIILFGKLSEIIPAFVVSVLNVP